MKCQYYYKGQLIGDIRQLDDFLLSRQKFESKYGDLVFQSPTVAMLTAVDKAKEMEKTAKALEDEYNKAKRAYVDGEEILNFPKPYRGVTEFLSGHRNEDDKLLFPEFIADNYWSNRYYAWNLGRRQEKDRNGKIIKDGFTDEEIELFFNGDDSDLASKRIPLGDPSTWQNSKGEFRNEWGSKEQNELRAKMEDKWKHQAQFGTELHNVLKEFFTRDEKTGKYNYENWENLDNIKLHNLFTKWKDRLKIISETTSKEKIKQLIDIAFKIKDDLIAKHTVNGVPPVFFPEITVSAELNREMADKKGYDKLLGRIDLMIIDGNGNAHLVDFKVSPKNYTDYNAAKELAYIYQLATYERMLRQHNLKTQSTSLYVAPIKFEGFGLNTDGEWDYTGLSEASVSPLVELTKQNELENIDTNISEYLDVPVYIDVDAEDVVAKVTEQQKIWWPTQGEERKKTLEEVKQIIENDGGFVKENGKYEYKSEQFGYEFTAKSENELFRKVLSFFNESKERNVKKTANIAKLLKQAQKNNEGDVDNAEITPWLRAVLSKYATSQWSVVEGAAGEAMQQFGMILLFNKVDNLYEVVKISNRNLDYQYNWNKRQVGDEVLTGKRTNLLGALEADLSEDSKSESLMLKATRGNLELMEAMLVLNTLDFQGESINLGQIHVINPFNRKLDDSQGTVASNRELKYCWDRLNAVKPIKGKNNFEKNGSIKLLNPVEICYRTFKEIMARTAEHPNYRGRFKNYESTLTDLIGDGKTFNREITLNALYDLERKLVKDNPELARDLASNGKSIHTGVNNYHYNYAKTLYQLIQQAILDLHGITVRQVKPTISNLQPESLNVLRDGLSSNMLDNAHNYVNKLLNDIANIALEGYQNTREQSLSKLQDIRRMVEEIKKDTGFSGVKEHIWGNQTELYKGMTRFTEDGDLRFLNPWKENTQELTAKQVEFLKHVILEINKQRHPTYSEEKIQQLIVQDDVEFFQVPLIEASFASKVDTVGWVGWIKDKFKPFAGIKSLKDFKQKIEDWARRKETQFLNPESEEETVDSNIFKIVNLMEQGNKKGADRLKLIANMRKVDGDGVFERDLERILMHHTYAYSIKDAMENRLPLMKAAYVSLAIMGNNTNKNYEKDLEFIEKWVSNKINHQSIEKGSLKPLKGVMGSVQKVVSFMALAFSPIQMTGQALDGIWQDVKLVITKPDGQQTFSKENMLDAMKIVYADLKHMSDEPTVTSALNAFYGINDMDSASFADNNSSNRHGFFNFFNRFAYKFASRPDYYNRMTIFTAQMMADGSLDAHSIDENGHLKYNWKKDKRFAAYANDPTGRNGKTDEWKAAKAMYYTVAKQLIQEGVKDENGKPFALGSESEPVALPKAYSNKESEARKAVGDNIYGYFDHTKKTLLAGTLAGSMILQMRTYWSAKKNKYLGKSGIKAQGKWVHAEQEVVNQETGEVKKEKVYYAKNEDGTVDYNNWVTESDPNASDVAFLQWQGKFEEGILLTVWDFLRTWVSSGSFKNAMDAKFGENVDPEMRKAYETNMKHFIADFVLWLLVGTFANFALKDWAEEEAKDAKKSGDFDDAMFATFATLCYRTVKYSSNDFIWWESIFGPMLDWNPMVLSHVGNDVANVMGIVTGDKSFTDAIVGSFSAAKQVKPLFTYVDQQFEDK